MREFITQLIIRLFSDKPWFFKVIQVITGLVAAMLLVPEWVTAFNDGGFSLPEKWTDFIQQIVGYALIAQAALSQLPVKTETKVQNKIHD